MKFRVSRTSGKTPPCEGAYEVLTQCRDKHELSLAEIVQQGWDKQWFSSGTNHREEDGKAIRDLPLEVVWVVELQNLDQLAQFVVKHEGEVIITTRSYPDYPGYPLGLEIYDDWRE